MNEKLSIKSSKPTCTRRARLVGLQSAAAHAVTDAVRSVLLSVAADAVNFVVRTVVQVGRIQRAMAVDAVEAATVPHLTTTTAPMSNRPLFFFSKSNNNSY